MVVDKAKPECLLEATVATKTYTTIWDSIYKAGISALECMSMSSVDLVSEQMLPFISMGNVATTLNMPLRQCDRCSAGGGV